MTTRAAQARAVVAAAFFALLLPVGAAPAAGSEHAVLAYGDGHVDVIVDGETERFPLSARDAGLAPVVNALHVALDALAAKHAEDLIPYDFDAAAKLYDLLLRPIAPAIAGATRVTIIPTGALHRVPFAALVDAVPDFGDPGGAATDRFEVYRSAAWAGNTWEFAYAPGRRELSEASARAVTRSPAPSGVLGAADPLFPERHEVSPSAIPTFGAPLPPAGATPALSDRIAAHLARMEPLPGTRRQIRRLMAAFGGRGDVMLVGSEASVLRFDAAEPARFRVIAWATHGLAPGEVAGVPEPALVTTPSGAEGLGRHGLLSPSELLRYRLEADMVLLLACNTGAAFGDGMPTGSLGLPDAMLAAGADSVVAVAWPIYEPTVTAFVLALAEARTREPGAPKSALIASARRTFVEGQHGAHHAHPIFWGGFRLIGDGGPMRRD